MDKFWTAALAAMTASHRLRRMALKWGTIIFGVSIPLFFIAILLQGTFDGSVILVIGVAFLGFFGFDLIAYAVLATGAAWVAKITVEDVKTDYIYPPSGEDDSFDDDTFDEDDDEPSEVAPQNPQSDMGEKFSRVEQARILNLLQRELAQKDDLSPDEKVWLLNLLSRDDLSKAQDICLNGLLLGLTDSDDKQDHSRTPDPATIHAKGEMVRLHLISSLQGDHDRESKRTHAQTLPLPRAEASRVFADLIQKMQKNDDLSQEEQKQLYNFAITRAPRSSVGKDFSRKEQTRIRDLVLRGRDNLSEDERKWLLRIVSREDLSPAKDAWIDELLFDMSGNAEEDPGERLISGEILRLLLIQVLQCEPEKRAEKASLNNYRLASVGLSEWL